MSQEILKVQELQIVDKDGNARMVLSTGGEGFPSIQFLNPDSSLPVCTLEVDSKGTHLKFSHPNSANSYFFLNNEGSSGLVMIDGKGQRRYQIIVSEDEEVKILNSDRRQDPY